MFTLTRPKTMLLIDIDPKDLWLTILHGVSYFISGCTINVNLNKQSIHRLKQNVSYRVVGSMSDWAIPIYRCDEIILNKNIKNAKLKKWLLSEIRPFLLELYFSVSGEGNADIMNEMLYNDDRQLKGWLLGFYPMLRWTV